MLKLDYWHLMGLLRIKQRKPHCILQSNKKGAIFYENKNGELMEFFAWNGFKKVKSQAQTIHHPAREFFFHFIKFQWEDTQARVAWSIIWSPTLTIPCHNLFHICIFISSPFNCHVWKLNIFVLSSITNTYL